MKELVVVGAEDVEGSDEDSVDGAVVDVEVPDVLVLELPSEVSPDSPLVSTVGLVPQATRAREKRVVGRALMGRRPPARDAITGSRGCRNFAACRRV